MCEDENGEARELNVDRYVVSRLECTTPFAESMWAMRTVVGETNMEFVWVGGIRKSEDSGVSEGVLKDCFFNSGKN